MKFKYLGNVAQKELPYESYVDISLNGQNIELEVLYEQLDLDDLKIKKMHQALEQLESIESNNRSILQQLYENMPESEVRFYMTEVLDDVLAKRKITITQTRLELLQEAALSRVILYPNPTDYLLMFEYIVLPQYNHYILTMNYDTDCQLIDVIMES
jgi:hypothetical protein